jgi:hypothetical protein
MAAEGLEQAAKAAGHEIVVETQGSAGSDPISQDVINAADAVIFAHDLPAPRSSRRPLPPPRHTTPIRPPRPHRLPPSPPVGSPPRSTRARAPAPRSVNGS